MDYEDRFNPAAMDNDTNSVEPKINNKKALVDTRKLDKNYEKYTIQFNKKWTDGRHYKNITVENFGSGQIGTRIRNAVTGQLYPYIVGHRNEDLLFKVSDSSGRNGRKETITLFYDSPDQYENHRFVTLDPSLKQKWLERSLQQINRANK